jgi:predicted ribosomally synthesized peptide with nif11-like leader
MTHHNKPMSIQALIEHAKQNDPRLLEVLKTATSPEAFVAAARELGYEVSADEARAQGAARRGRRLELLSEAELTAVAGGREAVRTTRSWTFGTSCCWC